DILEGAVCLAVRHDRLCLGETHAVERVGDGLRVGLVDVDRGRGEGGQGEREGQRQCGKRFAEHDDFLLVGRTAGCGRGQSLPRRTRPHSRPSLRDRVGLRARALSEMSDAALVDCRIHAFGSGQMDAGKVGSFISKLWDEEVVPQLTEYIKIPNKSPMFDKEWAAHGYMDAAVALMEKWARAKLESLPGSTLEVVRLPNRTPLIFIDVPASGNEARADDCVLLYGHLDKQPEMTG